MFGHSSFEQYRPAFESFQAQNPQFNIGDLFNRPSSNGFFGRRPQPFDRQPRPHPTGPRGPQMPGGPNPQQPTPQPQAMPSAPAQSRFANPFMPISSQPITFASMLSRQPVY